MSTLVMNVQATNDKGRGYSRQPLYTRNLLFLRSTYALLDQNEVESDLNIPSVNVSRGHEHISRIIMLRQAMATDGRLEYL